MADHGLDFVDADCAMHRDRHPAVVRERLAFERHDRRRDRQRPARQVDMRLAAVVPQLHEDAPALRMDGIRDLLPAGDVRVLVDARRAEIAAAVVRDVGRFGDDEPALRSALTVVLQHDAARAVVGVGAQARGWCVHDAMLQRVRSDPDRRKESGHDVPQ
jgi:hypothetical protein